MSETTTPAGLPAMILDFRAEGLITLCDKWERDMLTVQEFNRAYSEFCSTAPEGCSNEVFGTLAFRDADGEEREISFKVCANRERSEGSDMAAIMAGRVRFWQSERGREFSVVAKADATARSAFYQAAVDALVGPDLAKAS